MSFSVQQRQDPAVYEINASLGKSAAFTHAVLTYRCVIDTFASFE